MNLKFKLLVHKVFHWEYWPFQLIYIPIYFLWVYYAFRSHSIFFFNACNPSIKNGGFMNESKYKIYDLIPQKYYPKTIFIPEDYLINEVIAELEHSQIKFPLIAKPDIGLRGSAVKKINSLVDLTNYHSKTTFAYLLQDLIPYTNEVGLFYVRFPNQKKGIITGIVSKEFLIVKGDGVSNIETLLLQNPRYAFQLQALQKELGATLQEVLTLNESINLVPYGNHARGAKFIDRSDLISSKLTDVINELCLQIPEFYFGRLDIMYRNWEDLENNENFSIVELNGAASEPTHIYDPKHSLFFAWKELARHITYMYQISVANHKRGFAFLPFKKGMEEYRFHLKQFKKIIHF